MMRAGRLALVILLGACSGQQNALDPASAQNRSITVMFWAMLVVASLIWLAVTAAFLVPAVRQRRTTREEAEPAFEVPAETSRRQTRIVSAATAGTVLILLLFLIYDFGVGRALAAHPGRALTIELVGHQWWWEVHYADPDPSKIVIDANELHLPVGQPVQIKLVSRDVIHSFWVPNLIGKRDLIPGYTSSIFFTADRPGVYRAQCAEFCGHEHAKMALAVVAHPANEFVAWLDRQRTPAAEPSDSLATSGKHVFLSAACSKCHAITGVEAYGTVGPNLTHLASRRTLAAGTLPNTRGNLGGWIVDPKSIKPGARMPSNQLESRDLVALLAYLQTLK